MQKAIDQNSAFRGALDITSHKKHGDLALGDGICLGKGRAHEVMGDAAEMFAILAASRLSGPVIWIGLSSDVGSLSLTALQGFLDPARVILVTGVSRMEILWAAGQSLRMKGASCVVVELRDGPDLRESRRLQIAAEESGCLGIILIHGRAYTSAAETRWLCEASSAGDASWFWRQTKNKQGQLSAWRVEWIGKENAPDTIHMAAATAA